MAKNPAQRLIEFGQSIWYDNISRDILQNGELKRMIQEWGVRGLTSNPTIFDQAISKSAIYDDTIRRQKAANQSPDKIFETLAVEDIAGAADLLLPIYQSSGGEDGFVSIEVSPLLAANTKGTIEEAIRLHKALGRPNVMIKVPGTPEGLPAVKALLEEGISVNITLLFSVENYTQVAQAYCEALRTRVKKGSSVKEIRSVASFFVSRVDTSVDALLQKLVDGADSAKASKAKTLLGKFGIANSKLAYKRYQEIFEGDSFKDLRDVGAAVQRPLWASTGTKNPAYRDVLYIEELIGKNTVNTIPHNTLVAFVDHGQPRDSLLGGMAEAERVGPNLAELGIDVRSILHELQVDGVKKFADSFRALNETIAQKLKS